MPTNKIQKCATAAIGLAIGAGQSRPSVGGIAIDGTLNKLVFNPDGTQVTVNDSRSASGTVTAYTASTTLTTTLSGNIAVINTTTSVVITLPAASTAGFEVEVCVGVVAAGGQLHSISPNSADIIMFPLGGAGVANKDLVITQATEAIGNYVKLKADGTTTWYTTGHWGTFAREG